MKLYLTEDENLRNSGFSNATQNINEPRHRWYPVKEAFSPDLLNHVCDQTNLQKGALVFDPFSGSGTVCLSAALTGFSARATEVNPFLAFLGKTKLLDCEPEALESLYKRVKLAADSDETCNLESVSTFSPKGGASKWLFPLKPLRSFSAGFRSLNETPSNESQLLKLALLGSVMDCCNAFKDGKCLRYKTDWKENEASRADFFDYLQQRYTIMLNDIVQSKLQGTDCCIIEGDVRDSLNCLPEAKLDLIITSPPYLNSFDYSDIYRPEMFLGGFVESNAELMQIRLKTLRSHVQAKWRLPTDQNFGLVYGEAIETVISHRDSLWDKRIPLMIQAYFEDMAKLIGELRTHCRCEAEFWIVVSTSAYAGVEIPVDLILAELASSRGWNLKQISVVRQLRSSSQHRLRGATRNYDPIPLRESVVRLVADPKWKQKG